MKEWDIDFFNQNEFEKIISHVVDIYLKSVRNSIKKFYNNLIDPIKMSFDSIVYNKSISQVINEEINRQIDKTNNNAIGWFNQNIFELIKNCEVPEKGFDVIYYDKKNNKTIYAEIKNKWNTMNSSSKESIFKKMQNKIEENSNNICYLVEIISDKSKNNEWKLNGVSNPKIKILSVDHFYYEITNDPLAFKKICYWLPIIIKKIVKSKNDFTKMTEDTKSYFSDEIISLEDFFEKTFSTYLGFNKKK